jgi:hypothetical protein
MRSPEELSSLFKTAAQALAEADARSVLRRSGQRVNVALLEAVVVAAMRRVARGANMEVDQINAALEALLADPDISRSTTTTTANEDNVRVRLDAATRAFGGN